LVHFVLIWYIFSGFGITHPEKSGNPAVPTGKFSFEQRERWPIGPSKVNISSIFGEAEIERASSGTHPTPAPRNKSNSSSNSSVTRLAEISPFGEKVKPNIGRLKL
jgi:hypothetical protein